MTYPPMPPTAPGPVARPTAPAGPLSLSDLFTSSVTTLRARLGLFVALALAPIALAVLAVMLFAGLLVATLGPLAFSGRGGPDALGPMVGGLVGSTALFMVAMVFVSLMQYVLLGRTIVGGIDLGTGRIVPTWANLRERTPGLLGRAFVLMLIVIGLTLLAYVVLGGLLLATLLPLSGGADAGNAGGAVLLLILVVFAVMVLAVWIGTKVIFTLHGMAEDGLHPWEAIKNSWRMTKGVFWRTFGHYLVVSLVVGVVAGLPQFVLTPFARLNESSGVLAGVQIAVLLIAGLLSIALSVLAVPYQYIWTGLMYLSRKRELGASPVGPTGQAAPPPGWTPPAGPPGPQQGYPQQPWTPPPGGSTPQ